MSDINRSKIDELIKKCENNARPAFELAHETALKNQAKVLDAFKTNRISPRHFAASTGYGYDDIGRVALSKVFADSFCGQDAIVSPLFASGTHTISTVLFGLLRPGDTALSISGLPYDTLKKVIGFGNNLAKNNLSDRAEGEINNGSLEINIGSLKDFGIGFDHVNLLENGYFDMEKIFAALKNKPKIILVQRSRGYSWRPSVGICSLKNAIKQIRTVSDAPIIVDNCYCEFVQETEPLEVGANLIMGSLIKNAGGGLSPTGGYIVGDSALIKHIEGRYSAPGIGTEIGSYAAGYQNYFQGIFCAPHVVLQAVKSSVLFGELFALLGYEVSPGGLSQSSGDCCDIVRSIKLGSKRAVVDFCRAIQHSSPVDSFVSVEPWEMPGYENQVIMAAGTFVQGASIELSADAPIREPYAVHLQGALTYEHAKISAANCLIALIESGEIKL